MTALPPSTDFTNSSVTEAGFKTAISNLRAYLSFLFGDDGTKETARATFGAGFETGTRMAFQQSSAPIGWTKDVSSAVNDSILRLVTGSVSSGGSVGMSLATTGATTLSTSQMPSHIHSGAFGTAVGYFGVSGGSYQPYGGVYDPRGGNTNAEGGGGSHTHGLLDNVKYHDFIIAQKD